jgi:hypothetical protein
MQKLLPVFLSATVLSGCMSGSNQNTDWTLGNGCEEYSSETSRDLANCKAFVKAKEEANKTTQAAEAATSTAKRTTVSLDPAGDRVKMTQGMKENENFDRTLTE